MTSKKKDDRIASNFPVNSDRIYIIIIKEDING